MRGEAGDNKPAWWLLYAIGLLVTGLIGLVDAEVAARVQRTLLELGLAILLIALMGMWVRQNRAAIKLEDVERRRHRGTRP